MPQTKLREAKINLIQHTKLPAYSYKNHSHHSSTKPILVFTFFIAVKEVNIIPIFFLFSNVSTGILVVEKPCATVVDVKELFGSETKTKVYPHLNNLLEKKPQSIQLVSVCFLNIQEQHHDQLLIYSLVFFLSCGAVNNKTSHIFLLISHRTLMFNSLKNLA